ncbi:MAG: TIGR03936 family radical SAM-associated protein [Ruminococcus sp.]|nr:TIGR03936 family radical SAM-associated protein [Ruminococcus sp.]
MAEKMLQPKNVDLRLERFDRRIVYEKCGRAKYISHLDLMRAMQRAIKRAGLPVWYTQGFNPHIYLMFPLTLSLGFESRVEVMDLALLEDMPFEETVRRLDAQMSEGMRIVSCALPVHKHTEITHAGYKIRFTADRSPEECRGLFEEFLARDKIEIEKRTKKKTANIVDIRPFIDVREISCGGDGVCLDLLLPAGGSFSLNANVVIETFFEMYGLECDELCIERTKILIANGKLFT